MNTLSVPPPTVDDIFRYRYQHGTNVGPVFLHGPYPDSTTPTEDPDDLKELNELKRSIEAKGLDETKSEWQSHWLTSLTEQDLLWLKNVAKCNSIRLPVGYFTLGPLFCSGTPFEGEPSEVYSSCWNTVRHFLKKCYTHGIGVLIDFQTIPGRSHGRDHGEKGQIVDACPSSSSWILARDCVAFIVQEVTFHTMSEVIGVQISSDTDWRACDLEKWYDEVLEITSSINPSLPMFISDGGDLSAALDLAMLKNNFSRYTGRSPIVVDTHRYYNTGQYQYMDPKTLIGGIPSELWELTKRQKNVASRSTAVDVYVGEYSCAMHTQSLHHVDSSEFPALEKAFGQIQGNQWISKACGSAFYGYKIHNISGDAWNFEKQIISDAIPTPAWLSIPRAQVQELLQQAEKHRAQCRADVVSHISSYVNPSECQLYLLGWDIGFADALAFFGAISQSVIPGNGGGGDKLGATDLWVRKRITEPSLLGKELGVTWEDGLRRGLDDFYSKIVV